MDPENRPNAALINKEWFVAAKSVLSAEALGKVLVAACNYVIFGELEPKLSSTEGVVFAMIRPAMDSDITKYREKCARNAANARSGRERVGASGTQSQQVAANTTPTPTPITTTTQTLSREAESGKEIEREKWLIYGYFWSTGSKAIKEECNAFWSYYESLGWKNNKGAAIVSKIAAARMWRRQFETGTAPSGADAWFKVVQSCSVYDYQVWHVFLGTEISGGNAVVRLRCREEFLAQLRENTPRLEAELRAFWRGLEPIFETAG